MELDFKALCDYASLSQDGKVNIMGIFQEINPGGYPCIASNIFVVCSFKAFPGEYDMQKRVKLVLVDPDGKVLAEAEGEPLEVPRPRTAGGESRLNQIFGLQGLVFERHGPHSFDILVDNDTKGRIALLMNEPPRTEETP